MCVTEESLRQSGEVLLRLTEASMQETWRACDDGPDIVISQREAIYPQQWGWAERARIPMPIALRLARNMLKQHDANRHPLAHEAQMAMDAG